MQRSSLLELAFAGLEVIKAALASNFALELFEFIEAHARSVCPVKSKEHPYP